MRVEDLRPGWRTDLTLHGVGGLIEAQDDCLVVRTPSAPNHYWGNALILAAAPQDADAAHWIARFEREITQRQPASAHLAFAINTPHAGERLPAWEAAGLEMHVNAVMRIEPGQLVAPPPLPAGAEPPRAIVWPREVAEVVALECADTHGFEPAGYRAYRERQHERYAVLQARGQCEWFGLWCEGRLAASCGLMRDAAVPGATARFQHVNTHPDFRRRGLARALVRAAGAHALEVWQAASAVIVADPDDVAIALYRSLGWREFEREWCFERRAPQDRPA